MNTLTDIQIFNAALRRLGESKGVSAVDGSDPSYHGTLAGDIYYATRDEELRQAGEAIALGDFAKLSPDKLLMALGDLTSNGTGAVRSECASEVGQRFRRAVPGLIKDQRSRFARQRR